MKAFIVGFGNIGTNLVRIITKKNNELQQKYGDSFQIIAIADSKGVYKGFKNNEEILEAKLNGRTEKFRIKDTDITKSIADLDYDILVEVTSSTPSGEPGITYVKRAMEKKKHVVTANKSILVQNFDTIDYARKMGVIFKFEATVCGSIPVFNTIDNYYSKAKIKKVSGAFNATSSYIIRMMENGFSFRDALDIAIKEGLAERNYEDDLLGIDSARKALILHNYIFKKRMKMNEIENLAKIEDVKPGMGLISEIEDSKITIKYVEKSEKSKIFNFNGAGMSFTITTDLFNTQTLIVDQDGPWESAAAVYSDLVDILKVRILE